MSYSDEEELEMCFAWLKDKPRQNKINPRVTIGFVASKIGRVLNTPVSSVTVMKAVKELGILTDGYALGLPAELLETKLHATNEARKRKGQPLLSYKYNFIPDL